MATCGTCRQTYRICGARNANADNKANGKTVCMANPTPSGRCRRHGGATPVGIKSKFYQGKGFSKYLPIRLMDMMEEADSNPDILGLRDKVLLTDARLYELGSQLDVDGSRKMLEEAVASLLEHQKLQSEKNSQGGKNRVSLAAKPGQESHCGNANNELTELQTENTRLTLLVSQLSGTINRLMTDFRTWESIGDWIDRRQRLTESERKRLIEMRAVMTADQVMLMVGELVRILQRRVTDPDAMALITRDLITLFPPPGTGPLKGNELLAASFARTIDVEAKED